MKIAILISLLTIANVFASEFTSDQLPNWVLPNTKHAAINQAMQAAEDVSIVSTYAEQVLLSDGYAAVKATVLFNSSSGTMEQTAICNPIKNKLLCRYELFDDNGQSLTKSEGIFFRQE